MTLNGWIFICLFVIVYTACTDKSVTNHSGEKPQYLVWGEIEGMEENDRIRLHLEYIDVVTLGVFDQFFFDKAVYVKIMKAIETDTVTQLATTLLDKFFRGAPIELVNTTKASFSFKARLHDQTLFRVIINKSPDNKTCSGASIGAINKNDGLLLISCVTR